MIAGVPVVRLLANVYSIATLPLALLSDRGSRPWVFHHLCVAGFSTEVLVCEPDAETLGLLEAVLVLLEVGVPDARATHHCEACKCTVTLGPDPSMTSPRIPLDEI